MNSILVTVDGCIRLLCCDCQGYVTLVFITFITYMIHVANVISHAICGVHGLQILGKSHIVCMYIHVIAHI